MPKVELNLEDDELKELLLGDRDKAMQSIMAKILDEILKSEATEQIKAKAYERSDERTNSRNGYRVRQLTTRVGTLELHVPNSVMAIFQHSCSSATSVVSRPLIWH